MSEISKWVFATNNPNKLKEVRLLLEGKVEIVSLKDIGCYEELPETHETLEDNSLEKAAHVYENYDVSCFAEDTGLEVDALDGEPGVYSARYAGEANSSEDNMDLLLQKMQGIENRKARFRTVITVIDKGEVHQFMGIVNGEILAERSGEKGFGYDPIFKPEGYKRSFAEMTMEKKSAVSHRGQAVAQLVTFLQQKVD